MILNYMKLKSRSLNLDLSEYMPDWNDPATDERLINLKERFNNLEQWEKNILALYAKLGTYRKVGDFLFCSHSAVIKTVKKIKTKLLT